MGTVDVYESLCVSKSCDGVCECGCLDRLCVYNRGVGMTLHVCLSKWACLILSLSKCVCFSESMGLLNVWLYVCVVSICL